jgi:hypothetical protein
MKVAPFIWLPVSALFSPYKAAQTRMPLIRADIKESDELVPTGASLKKLQSGPDITLQRLRIALVARGLLLCDLREHLREAAATATVRCLLSSKPFWSSLKDQLRNASPIPAKNVRVPLLRQRQLDVAVAVDRVRAGTSSNSFGQLLQGSIRAAAQSGIVASFRSNPDGIRIHSAPKKIGFRSGLSNG